MCEGVGGGHAQAARIGPPSWGERRVCAVKSHLFNLIACCGRCAGRNRHLGCERVLASGPRENRAPRATDVTSRTSIRFLTSRTSIRFLTSRTSIRIRYDHRTPDRHLACRAGRTCCRAAVAAPVRSEGNGVVANALPRDSDVLRVGLLHDGLRVLPRGELHVLRQVPVLSGRDKVRGCVRVRVRRSIQLHGAEWRRRRPQQGRVQARTLATLVEREQERARHWRQSQHRLHARAGQGSCEHRARATRARGYDRWRR